MLLVIVEANKAVQRGGKIVKDKEIKLVAKVVQAKTLVDPIVLLQ
jgi:hypothetical protein